MINAPVRFPISVTSSLLEAGEKCDQLFYQQYVERIQPDGFSVHLVAGGAFAFGLAAARRSFYEQGNSLERARCDGMRAFLGEWSEDNDGWPKKPIDQMLEALYAYTEAHPFDTDELQPAQLGHKRGIEFSFALELPIKHPDSGDPLLYEGRCDAISTWGDGLFPTDEKTTGNMGAQWAHHFRLRGQFFGYTWAARQMGHQVNGVFVRGIGLRKDGPVFAQVPIFTPPYLIERWYQSMLNKTQRLVNAYKKDRDGGVTQWPFAFGFACTAYGGCPFVDRCASQNPKAAPGYTKVEKLYFE